MSVLEPCQLSLIRESRIGAGRGGPKNTTALCVEPTCGHVDTLCFDLQLSAAMIGAPPDDGIHERRAHSASAPFRHHSNVPQNGQIARIVECIRTSEYGCAADACPLVECGED